MRITYVKLENVAGIAVGMSKDILEINFDKSINKIVAIQARNGTGKSVLLSSLTPFAYVTTLDDRSTLSYITPKKNGYKEIHYQDGEDVYIIKHYFKASKDTHTVKSYFMKNGEELNENGNVTSFNALVEMHFGLTQEMMRLIRIGSNVNSFITLSPARRKEYIGKLIEEIDLYLQIYKKVNDDIRVVKTMLQANNTNLYNCHITDPVVEEEKLTGLAKDIRRYEQDRDHIIGKISGIDSMMKNNNINELRQKQQDAETAIREFERLSEKIKKEDLEHITIDELIKRRTDLYDKKLDVQSKINSLRITIDNIMRNIERLQISINKITSNNDIKSLIASIQSLRDLLSAVPQSILTFKPLGSSSAELQDMLSKLQSFNQIAKMIISLGNKPIEVYLKIKRSDKFVEKWLKEQEKKSLSRMNETDIRALMEQVFQGDLLITPNCDTEYAECPYYRFHEVITTIRDKMEEESYSDDILQYIQIINNNVDVIMNELDRMDRIKIPDRIRDNMNETRILDRLDKHLPFFDLTDLQEYIAMVREYEIYIDSRARLEQYEHQLSVYQQAGIGSYSDEIKRQEDSIESYKKEINELTVQLSMIQKEFGEVESQIALVTKFNDAKKYHRLMESTLSSTKKILEPLESAASEKSELEFQLRQHNNLISLTREQHRSLEAKISEYNRLVEEGKKLSKKNRDLGIIQEAVSTKKGIPVFYMKRYLTKIQKLANELLSLIYDDEFRLAAFNVTPETFEVPYVKNGRKIADIKYASQSEIALGTMALSFALSKNASDKYNILLLDEIDAGLDELNRSAFLKMLYMQMEALNAEQVFIISHNLTQMTNVPMDCIRLSDIGQKLKMQNIIYE